MLKNLYPIFESQQMFSQTWNTFACCGNEEVISGSVTTIIVKLSNIVIITFKHGTKMPLVLCGSMNQPLWGFSGQFRNSFKKKKKLFILYWGIANEQYCDSFIWTAKGLSHSYTCIHSPPNSPPNQAGPLFFFFVNVSSETGKCGEFTGLFGSFLMFLLENKELEQNEVCV